MLRHLRASFAILLLMTVLLGLAYPLAMTGLARAVFPAQAAGSLIERDGKVVGSSLIGQSFAEDRYFQGRPSATVDTDPKDATKTVPAPYNAANSAGSNLGPTSKALVERVQEDVSKQGGSKDKPVPGDLVTTSGSGLDPHISPSAAAWQVARVAKARNRPEAEIQRLVAQHTEGREIGLLGEPRVNVLKLNLALDALPAR
jgi:potassium-transporting ATPase KdpC subunit